MENKSNTTNTIRQSLNESMQRLADISMNSAKPVMDTMFTAFSEMNKSVFEKGVPTISIPKFQLQNDDCCAPKNTCPPHCISTITRHAAEGERIIVPFMVKNSCNVTKTYRVGVRELINSDGTMAPSQPYLDKDMLTLDPGRSERVLMGIDLANFTNGSTYTAEIVLREKEINQNICFTLLVDAYKDAHVVTPIEEQKYRLRWQSWQSHFYCEPPQKDRG